MKRFSIKEVNELLKNGNNYCIRINEITRKVHLVRIDFGCVDDIIGYLTFNQFINLDLIYGLLPLHINSFMYEPLIDMSIEHLIGLYRECKVL